MSGGCTNPRAKFLCEGSVHASTRVSIEYNSTHPSAKFKHMRGGQREENLHLFFGKKNNQKTKVWQRVVRRTHEASRRVSLRGERPRIHQSQHWIQFNASKRKITSICEEDNENVEKKTCSSTFSVWMCDCEDFFFKKSLRCHSVSPLKNNLPNFWLTDPESWRMRRRKWFESSPMLTCMLTYIFWLWKWP